ncbi:hypothetical protein OSB04_030708 [Centaurea solstitialis]|uniref:Phytosulfokine n=1 Tax=Centaurea solstitialis TaxID=347529 RepID=A0AA38S861_9ASTR|nr:hypothetical protein OSB04_030708 [Centaurea solstitialis]
MSKNIRITTFCMIAIVLLSMLSCTVARPLPAFNDVTPVETHLTEEEVAKVKAQERCSGPGEEECLARSTLAAHIDYIYTQKKRP